MPIFHAPVAVRPAYHPAPVAVRPVYHPAARPYVAPHPYMAPRPAYVPRVVTRTVLEPGRTVYRDRFIPGASVTRNIYHTTYVNRGPSLEQRRAFEEGVRRREYDRLIREQGLSAEVAAAQAQAYAAQQALQMQQLQAQQAILNPAQTQSTPVSPGSPAADMPQDQTAADAGGDDGGGHDGGHKHMLLFGGLAVGAAVVGYMALKKHKKKSAD